MSRLASSRVKVFTKSFFGTGDDPYPLAVRFRDDCRAMPQADVMAFGDSVYERVSLHDEDKRKLPEMLAEALDGRTLMTTSFSAYTSSMYVAFLELAEKLGARPGCVVLSFNLRCLSPQWDASPIWQYHQENAILRALAADVDGPVGAVAPVYLDEDVYHPVAINTPLSQKRTIGEFRQIIADFVKTGAKRDRDYLGEMLAYHYGVPATAGHRQLAFLRSAIEAGLRLGSTVLVYLTPVNYKLMRAIWDDDLMRIVQANVRLVGNVAATVSAPDRVIVKDWSELLGSSHFFHSNELTEHLAQSGRIKLVRQLALAIPAQPRLGAERMIQPGAATG